MLTTILVPPGTQRPHPKFEGNVYWMDDTSSSTDMMTILYRELNKGSNLIVFLACSTTSPLRRQVLELSSVVLESPIAINMVKNRNGSQVAFPRPLPLI